MGTFALFSGILEIIGTNQNMHTHRPLIEICVNSVESALRAQQGGADRVELCENLFEGGTTPSAGSITVARRHLATGLMVMVRPRGGDFLYSDVEFEVMRHDVRMARELGADGIVLGLLTPDGHVDVPRTAELVGLAGPLPITFHRAFDMAADPFRALEDLAGLGVARILTSGRERSAFEGAALIAQLVRQAAGRIIILPGGGIHERNAAAVLAQTGATEIHLSANARQASGMTYRNTALHLGGALYPPEYEITVTDPGKVSAVRQATL
jgi:copper homeostasis protein